MPSLTLPNWMNMFPLLSASKTFEYKITEFDEVGDFGETETHQQTPRRLRTVSDVPVWLLRLP